MTEAVVGLGGISAKAIEHSISAAGVQLLTLQLKYPRWIHAEYLTHRVFSRNASSSRAIPVAKMLEQVRKDPAMPIHWGKNQAGMQAREELTGFDLESTKSLWLKAANEAADIAEAMSAYGAHKQIANRILEPFQFIHVIMTSTEWVNFFELRNHEDAQPEIHELARVMLAAKTASQPVLRSVMIGHESGWHLPYVTAEERAAHVKDPQFLAKISAARCARVSYVKHDGTNPSIEEDLALYDRLVGGVPLHASPIEHQACPFNDADSRSGNFRGWYQFRTLVEQTLYNNSNAT